jgi:hypothetical protein
MSVLLFLDDIRNPFDLEANWLVFSPFELLEGDEVIWVKSYNEFVEYITDFGVPDGICFDHDLADEHYNQDLKEEDYKEKTGKDCANFLVEYCLDNETPLPLWNCQSANPTGKENINSIMNNFKKYQDESKTCLPTS